MVTSGSLIKGVMLNMGLFLLLDTLWLKGVAGRFFLEQLGEAARVHSDGSWNVRVKAAFLVYVLMALSLEMFVIQNKMVWSLKDHALYGAFLGLTVYGVFDLTNRAILSHYPLKMVVMDMAWGTFLFSMTAFISVFLRQKLNFLN